MGPLIWPGKSCARLMMFDLLIPVCNINQASLFLYIKIND